MTRLPRLKGREIIRILELVGFRALRTKGSHTFLKRPDGRATVVPLHSGETIGPGLPRAILRDVEMSVDDLLEKLSGSSRRSKRERLPLSQP